jgi:phosphotransferase system enzyme I (PtsP)
VIRESAASARLRDMLAAPGAGQDRLDQITHLIADSMGTEVCSIYLFRDAETLELCATEGLKKAAVHKTRMRWARGWWAAWPAPAAGEHRQCPGRKGLPLHARDRRGGVFQLPGRADPARWRKAGRAGRAVRDARQFSEDEVYGWKSSPWCWPRWPSWAPSRRGDGMPLAHAAGHVRGGTGQEGAAEGRVWLHEPRVVITNPVGDDPLTEIDRLREGVALLRACRSTMLSAPICWTGPEAGAGGLPDVRPFARLAAPDGRRHHARPVGRGGGGKGTIAARARLEQAPTPICATGCTIWTICRTGCCAS